MKHLREAIVSALLLGALAVAGCSKHSPADAPAARIPEISVDRTWHLLSVKACVPVDANSEQTRTEQGTLPGARLLTSSASYDVAHELPGDKTAELVFYCGGTQCTASDTAARRAVAAGYRNVKIMRAGIRGWVAAGKPIGRPPRS